jgi:Fe-S-cluster-containing dehydrogenase component
MSRRALLVDLDRCTGCQTCVVACKAEKRLPAGVSLIRLVQVGPTGEFPELSMYYLPLGCQQCAEPACAAACPEDAIAATSQGIVAVDPALCTACGDCLEACPYGAIVLGQGDRVARKCDLCAELLAVGKQAACVAVCPGKALAVVEAEDARGAGPTTVTVTAAPAGRAAGAAAVPLTLKAAAGTEPAGRFLLTRQPWKDDV